LNISTATFIRNRFPLAIVAGLLLALSFPNMGIAGFAWIAPGLMLAGALGKSDAESFRIGYVAGLAHYLASLYWLLLIPYRWHGIPLGPALGWLALSAYLALFPAAWVWMAMKMIQHSTANTNTLTSPISLTPSPSPMRWARVASDSPLPPRERRGKTEGTSNIEHRTGGTPSPHPGPLPSLRGSGEGERKEHPTPNIQHSTSNIQHPMNALEGIAAWSWSRRIVWAIFCAAGWVALEMILVRLLGGFPWNLLGASQYQILPLIQIASVTGIHGVSFLVVWTSVSLLCAVAVIIHRPSVRSVWFTEMIFPMLAVAITFAFGFHRITHLPQPTRELNVALIQPAIPQTLIWDESEDMNRFRALMQLTESALTNEIDLLLWPEAAIPKMIRYAEEIRQPVLNLARTHRVWMIVGSDDAEPARDSNDPDENVYFNSAFLISPDGELADRYSKRNLVIFGEFIPRWLPFLKWFTPIRSGFTPGDKAVVFEMKLAERRSPDRLGPEAQPSRADSEIGVPIKTAPLICYEDMFPKLAREGAKGDTDFLVNLTNDGWFGEAAAQWQQAASAAFRAVENGLPLVRCANTGVTCWIDEAGRIREIFADANGSVYGAGFAVMKIQLQENRAPTFYHKHGDWFGWSCVGVSVVVLAWRIFQPARGHSCPQQRD